MEDDDKDEVEDEAENEYDEEEDEDDDDDNEEEEGGEYEEEGGLLASVAMKRGSFCQRASVRLDGPWHSPMHERWILYKDDDHD